MFSLSRVTGIVALSFTLGFSEPSQDTKPSPIFTSWASFSFGQVAKSPTLLSGVSNQDINMNEEILSYFDAGIKITTQPSMHTKGRFHLGLRIYNNISTINNRGVDLTIRKVAPNILDAALQSTWGGIRGGSDTIVTEIGLFPFQYNPQAQDLGEYLFRSGTYPGTLYSEFETTNKVKLCGVHLSYILNGLGRLKQDFFITNELEQYPMHDFNLAYVADYAPASPLDFGIGVCFAHLLSIDERKTTPWTDTARLGVRRSSPSIYNWYGYVDPVTHDTTIYTFRGIKAMARCTVDPLWFLRYTGLFGKEDGKLYTEAAILGVQDYPGWYSKLSERIPVMFGCNIPAFKLFDVLSVEGEYYGSKYWNSPWEVWNDGTPLPFVGNTLGYPDLNNWTPKNDNHWKWAVYASRKIGNNIRLSAQIASDHLNEMLYSGPAPSYIGYREVVPRTQDWYYMTRMMVYF